MHEAGEVFSQTDRIDNRETHLGRRQAGHQPQHERLQGIDDVLSGLCARSPLHGNDFLPVVVRLDELMSHAASMRFIHQHLVLLRTASAALAARDERAALQPTDRAVLELS